MYHYLWKTRHLSVKEGIITFSHVTYYLSNNENITIPWHFFVVLITNYAKKSVTLPTRVSCTLNLTLINDTESLSMLAICRFVLTHEITINISNLHNHE